jgi:hypothetical protein
VVANLENTFNISIQLKAYITPTKPAAEEIPAATNFVPQYKPQPSKV